MEGARRAYLKGLGLAFTANFLWALGTVVIVKLFTAYKEVEFILLIRYILSILFLGVISFKVIRPRELKEVLSRPLLWFTAWLVHAGALYPLFLGFYNAPVGVVTLLWNVFPLLVIGIGVRFFGERFHRWEMVGTVIVVVASAILVALRYGAFDLQIGVFWTLVSILATTAGYFMMRFNVKEQYMEEFNLLGITISTLFMFGVFLLIGGKPASIAWISVIFDWRMWYMVVAMTVVAYYVNTKATYYLEVSEVMFFTYLQSVMSVVFEALFLGVKLTGVHLLLLGIILIGFIIGMYGAAKDIQKGSVGKGSFKLR